MSDPVQLIQFLFEHPGLATSPLGAAVIIYGAKRFAATGRIITDLTHIVVGVDGNSGMAASVSDAMAKLEKHEESLLRHRVTLTELETKLENVIKQHEKR